MNEKEIIEKAKRKLEFDKKCNVCGYITGEKDEVLRITEIENILTYIETLKKHFEIIDHECSRLEKEDIRKDMMINKIFDYMLDEVIYEADLDNIYEKLYNECGASRNWCRGKEEEKKMLRKYFEEMVDNE